ncbi:hypothetical protein ACH5BK_07940 [Arcobacter sp. YIC-80]|uniref:hypothetical protein n=1 Tax=Arcobacter sp. YIC-80 TaxID=3376683 RepID=UPI00384FD227
MTEAEAKTVGANKGFLSQRFDTVQDALNGPGSWKTKLGLAASALVLGSQSEAIGNILNAIPTPDNLFNGMPLGEGSDIVPPPNYQMQQAQSQLIPSIAQNQLNNIPTAMPFMANNSNGMAQQGLISMIQQQYLNNTQAFNSGTMSQSAYTISKCTFINC